MANEFQHKDPGTALTQAEYITTDGTGHIFDSQAQGDILYATSTTVLARLGKDANDSRVLTNTGTNNNPAWAQVTLTTGVTGTLPVGNGGTGATTLNNLITLGTHTTGNYAATVADAGAGGITVANSGAESAAITVQLNVHGLTTDTIASGDFVAFSDENEANDVTNKLTVDNLMETGLPLVTEDTVAVSSDYMVFLDGGATGNANKESIADFVSGIAGTGLSASSGQLTVSAGGWTLDGGNSSEGTTTSTSTADIITIGSLSIASPRAVKVQYGFRKTTGASDDVRVGLKMNSTEVRADSHSNLGTGNSAQEGVAFGEMYVNVSNYLGSSRWMTAGNHGGFVEAEMIDMPAATITDVTGQGLTDSASNTLGQDELIVMSVSTS